MNSKSLARHFPVAATLLIVSAMALGTGEPGENGDKSGSQAKQPDRSAKREVRPGDSSTDRKFLRDRLTRHLAETRKLEDRIQSAIDRLEKGESTELVLKDIDMARSERPEGRGESKESFKPMTSEERAQALEFMREHLPRAAAKLDSSKEQPEITDRVLSRFSSRIRELMTLKNSDPKLFTLRLDEMRAGFDVLAASRDLNLAVHDSTAQVDTSALEASIKEAVGRRFDAQLAAQRIEAESLGSRMEQLKSEIDRKSANRDTAVAEETARVIERARHFDGAMQRNKREPGTRDPNSKSRPRTEAPGTK